MNACQPPFSVNNIHPRELLLSICGYGITIIAPGGGSWSAASAAASLWKKRIQANYTTSRAMYVPASLLHPTVASLGL